MPMVRSSLPSVENFRTQAPTSSVIYSASSGADRQAMGIGEIYAMPPAAQEFAMAIEHHHRVITARHDIHHILPTDRDIRGVTKGHPRRQLRPAWRGPDSYPFGGALSGHLSLYLMLGRSHAAGLITSPSSLSAKPSQTVSYLSGACLAEIRMAALGRETRHADIGREQLPPPSSEVCGRLSALARAECPQRIFRCWKANLSA